MLSYWHPWQAVSMMERSLAGCCSSQLTCEDPADFMPGRMQVLLFRGRGCGERCKRHQPCPPSQQLDGLTVRDFRRLRQSLVRLGVMQTQLAVHRPPNGCLSPLWMLHQ